MPSIGDPMATHRWVESYHQDYDDSTQRKELSIELNSEQVVITNVITPLPVSIKPEKPETLKIEFDAEQGSFVQISDAQMEQWEDAYRGLDIDAELTRAESWYIANPRKRKRNHQRFIVNWLARAHDRMRNPPPRAKPASARPAP